MPPPYSYDLWQQWLPFLRGGWRCPPGDQVGDRLLDTRRVTNAQPWPWAPELRNTRIEFRATGTPWMGSVAGLPIQRVPATGMRFRTWTENNIYTGRVTRRQVPDPIGTAHWLEGNPNVGGAWDHHVLLVCPETRESWELIGANTDTLWCMAYGYYRNGVLVDGMSACAAGVSLPPILLGRDDPPGRRMGIVINDYVGRDGTKRPGSGWPSCGDVLRLSPVARDRLWPTADAEQRRFLTDAHAHGFVLYDRMVGHPDTAPPVAFVGQQAGARWDTSTLRRLDLRLSDLDLVTG